MINAVRAAIVIIAILSTTSAALAQTPEQRIVGLNQYLERGFAALDIQWRTAPPPAQATAITTAEEVSAAARRAVTSEVKDSPFYPPLAQRLADLDGRIVEARAVRACGVARAGAIEAIGKADERAANAALNELGSALRDLSRHGRVASLHAAYSADKAALDRALTDLRKALAMERTRQARVEAEATRLMNEEARARAIAEAEAQKEVERQTRAAAAAAARKALDDEKARLDGERQAKAVLLAEERAQRHAEREAKARAVAEAARLTREARLRAEEEARSVRAAEAAEKVRFAAMERARLEEERRRERDDPQRVSATLHTAMANIDDALRSRPGPVSAALFKQAEAALSELRRVAPARAELETAAFDLSVLRAAVRQPGLQLPHGGRAVRALPPAHAASDFETRDGWCYAFLSSTEATFDVTLTVSAPVVRFAQSSTASAQLSGFCTAQSGTAGVTLQREDPQATVTVVGWRREELPPALVLRARLIDVDPCHERQLDLAWSDVVPGTVAFVGEGAEAPVGPVLLLDPGDRGSTTVRVLGADGEVRNVGRVHLRGQAADTPPPAVPPEQCPGLGARFRENPEPTTCRRRSDETARAALVPLLARLRSAPDDVHRAMVESELRALDDEAARRRAVDCAPYDVSPARPFRLRHHAQVLAQPPPPGSRIQLLTLERAETRP